MNEEIQTALTGAHQGQYPGLPASFATTMSRLLRVPPDVTSTSNTESLCPHPLCPRHTALEFRDADPGGWVPCTDHSAE